MCFKAHRKRKQGENSFTSQNLGERGSKMKDNGNELNADVESRHAKSIRFFFFVVSKTFGIKVTSLLCSLWPRERENTPYREVFHTLKSHLLKNDGKFFNGCP